LCHDLKTSVIIVYVCCFWQRKKELVKDTLISEKLMRRILKGILILIPVALISLGFYLKSNDQKEEIVLRAILENLKNYHFEPKMVNDDLSKMAFDNYLDFIDGNKRFLTKTEIDQLSVYLTELDDQALSGKYDFFNKSVELIESQIDVCQGIYREILDKPFDFTEEESVDLSEDIAYAANVEELKERWHGYLKYNVMTRLATAMKVQESKLEKDPDANQKTLAEMEKDARKAVLKNHDDWFNRLKRLDRKDRLTAYINAFTTLFDPHTQYFPPADKDNFDIRMSGQLEGIGAQLQEKDGYIKVTKIIPGSPSALQGELKANDLILKVAQGDGEPVDIVNARIDDAVKLIRGKKGTEVRLTVQKPDGTVVVIPIIRDVVVLEETYAKSVLLNDGDGVKIGYTYLPSFYADFKRNGGRSCSEDIKNELGKLEKNGAQALILDLRNNGGGSLMDVVEMAGYFIDKGPVVQVKSRRNDPEILRDKKRGTEWDKPVIIMVNEFSASASEILAAALQDYKRALIVGSHTTHGKGTVQRFIDLNRTLRQQDGLPQLGSLKLTMQKFYRINGGTTQLQGVTPDIIWPDNYRYIETGEKEQEYALQVTQISAAEYEPVDDYDKCIKKARKASEKRVSGQEIFEKIDENAQRWKMQRDKDVFTLNLDEYIAEKKKNEEVSAEYSALFKPFEDLSIQTMPEDQVNIQSDSTKIKLNSKWHERLKKDVYLYETLQIAEDMVK
jgi:carboxyl-terminal processing protease